MKNFLTLILFLNFTSSLWSQVDSLINRLPQVPDAEKVRIMGDITYYLATSDIEKSLKFGYEELALAKKLQNDTLIALAHNDLSIPYYFKGNYDSVLFYNKKSLEMRKSLGDKMGVGANLNKIGSAYYEMGDLKNAMTYLSEALNVYIDLKDSVRIGMTYNAIGNVLHRSRNYKDAISFFEKSRYLGNRFKNTFNEATALGNLANAYQKLGDNDKAQTYFYELVEIVKEFGYTEVLASAYQGLGVSFRAQKKHEKGLEYYLKALDIYKKVGSDVGVGLCYVNIGSTYRDLGEDALAEEYLRKGLEISENQATPYQLKLAYEGMYYYSKKKGRDKEALKYIEKFNSIKDSIYNQESQIVIGDLKEQIEDERQRNELVESKLLLADTQLQVRSRTILSVSVLSGTIILLMLFFFILKRQQAKRRWMEQENILKIEKERLRISRDLHDNLGAELTAISFISEGEMEQNSWKNVGEHSRSAMSQLRETIWAIHKEETPLWQLVDKLREHARKMFQNQETTVKINSENKEVVFLPNQTLHLYRICQELINNAAKHANASKFSIQITELNARLHIVISDNGKGFPVNQTSHGYGMQNLKSRIAELEGNIEIISSPEKGTTITLNIPVELS